MSKFNFNQRCQDLLADYKRRDGKRVAKRLDFICELLGKGGDRAAQTKFGGSVSKRTYVQGLSDVDVLLIVNDTKLKNQPPSKVLKHVRGVLKHQYREKTVKVGKLAVSISFSKGPEIQILPAIRTKAGEFRIAQPGSSKWSNVVLSEKFVTKLTNVNRATDGRAGAVIKLAKALAGCHINNKEWKISGYHMEALAVGAFEDYKRDKSTKSMLDHFLEYSVRAVIHPIDDLTNQSRFVDGKLGTANSKKRQQASKRFENLRGQVRNCNTVEKFNRLFCR